MSYIKVKDKSIVEPTVKGKKVLKVSMFRDVYEPPVLVSRILDESKIPFQVLDPIGFTPFSVGSATLTVDSYNPDTRTVIFSYIKVQGSGTYEQYDPTVSGMIVTFISGNLNINLSGTFQSGGAGYSFTVEKTTTTTITYSQTDWNKFVTETWEGGEYVFKEDILWEEANNYEWTYYGRIGDTVQRNPNVDLIGASSSDIYDKWQPTRSFLNKYAYIYLGYDYRGYYGAPGDPTSIAHIYEYYRCEISSPIVPTYSWVYRGEYMFSIRDANRYDINNDVVDKQYSIEYLNTNYPPGVANERKLAGDYLRTEYIQVSPGVYQYMHFYDVYECARIS